MPRETPQPTTSQRTTGSPSAMFGLPMAHVGLNLFNFASTNHIICVDRWSGFPLYKTFLGQFNKWCAANNVKHELASPYNPQGNGLAEAGVKNVKTLLAKGAKAGEDPQKSLYHWRNVPLPAHLLFGKKQFTSVPATKRHFFFFFFHLWRSPAP